MAKRIRRVIIVLFVGLYLSLHLLKVQITPLFIFGMYSKKVPTQQEYMMYELVVDNETIKPTELGRLNREIIIGPLEYYFNHKTNMNVDPIKSFVLSKRPKWESNSVFKWVGDQVFTKEEELSKFPNWYKSYLEQSIGKEIQRLEVFAKYSVYQESMLVEKHKELILSI